MRLAPYLPKFAILAAGVAIGLATAFAVRPTVTTPAAGSGVRAEPGPTPTAPAPLLGSRTQTRSGSIPIKGSSAELGAILLQRIGSHLIADDRASSQGEDSHGDAPVVFYASPKPFGDTLCRVDVYTIAPEVFRGRWTEQEKWDDDLKIETRYGLWKRPHEKGGDRDRACSAFRGFGHLISEGSVVSVARGAFVLDTIIKNARVGKSPYALSCINITRDRNPKPIPCDPLTVLRILSLKDLYRTEMKSEAENARGYVREDELLVAGEGIKRALKMSGPVIVTINVKDAQYIGGQSMDEAEPLSVAIEISELD